jgi:hypothetical protein
MLAVVDVAVLIVWLLAEMVPLLADRLASAEVTGDRGGDEP